MAALTIHRQEINIKDLPTTSVILYPFRAQVTRDLKDIEVKPGTNEIQIYGITPTVDEHSIQFNGTATTSIIDMTVDLVPNKESFNEAFPPEQETESEEMNEDEEDDKQDGTVKVLERDLKALRLQSQEAEEVKNSAQRRLDTLDMYCKQLNPNKTDFQVLAQTLRMYKEEREKAHADQKHADVIMSANQMPIQVKEQKLFKLNNKKIAEANKVAKKQFEEKIKKQRLKNKRLEEKRRDEEEAAKYWPNKVYKVTLLLDVSIDTPGTSRRSSVSSATFTKENFPADHDSDMHDASRSVSFSMTYVTSDASWTPCYDINFSTPNKSGAIIFRAEFKNGTSETWSDTSISLSTSQTSYHGLGDGVPWMQPWHITLRSGGQHSALCSTQESEEIGQTHRNKVEAHYKVRREKLLGFRLPQQQTSTGYEGQKQRGGAALFGSAPIVAQATGSSLFGQVQASQARFLRDVESNEDENVMANLGVSNHASPALYMQLPQQAQARRQADQQAQQQQRVSRDSEEVQNQELMAMHSSPFVPLSATAIKPEDAEAIWADDGLTATYDVPGKRTLAPSSLPRRNKIASLHLNNVELTSICVPKLQASVFLRARFKNPSSSLTLLRGTANLTLDGTFLGRTTLKRMSPSETTNISLGVDPSVHVNYAKPSVKRSSTGMFTKESNQLFTRCITLTNTKKVPLDVLVLDQIPVSEEDKLKVDVVRPAGLLKEGDRVATGDSAREGARKDDRGKGKWGAAAAALKKNGEVAWNVRLEAGGACRLPLEYETRCSGNEVVVSK